MAAVRASLPRVWSCDGSHQLSDAGPDLAKYYLDPETLPDHRVLVEFRFPDERPTNRRYWLLAECRSAELCYSHPGGEPDAFITARSEAFTQWHLGNLDWRQGLADGSITVSGSTTLTRAIPTWNRHPRPVRAAAGR